SQLFLGKAKVSAWDTWSVYEEFSEAFLQVIENRNEVEILKVLKVIERYVVLLYDRSSTAYTVNELKKQLFTQKTRTIDNIPPTRDALLQHTKRSAYQGSVISGNCLVANPRRHFELNRPFVFHS
ncbi:Hypothetical predicted protein, partial [Mytilus galloprovincialis]